MARVDRIGNMSQWIRETGMNQIKIGIIASCQFGSINTIIARINSTYRDNGEDKWVKHWLNRKQCRVAIMLITRTEREETEKDITLRNRYDEHLPRFFHNDDNWKVGTVHD